jgi:hypothetical protein
MRELQGTWLGAALDDHRVYVTGWFQLSFTPSTDAASNQPMLRNDRVNPWRNWAMDNSYRRGKRKLLGLCCLGAGLLTAAAAPAGAQAQKVVPPGTPVTITVVPAAAPAPPVSIALGSRHGHVTPARHGCTHTGGGNTDVAQPGPDTLVVTMSGVVVAYGSPKGGSAAMNFDLEQCFEVSFDSPKVKKAKLTLEARVIGLLRSHCKGGSAGFDNACASVTSSGAALVQLCLEPHAVGGGENLSVNDRDGAAGVGNLPAGKYTFHQTFAINALGPKTLLPVKAPSAEFAPDPALDPLWISYKEPFHGAAKKDFGFQVTLKVADDSDSPGTENGADKLP